MRGIDDFNFVFSMEKNDGKEAGKSWKHMVSMMLLVCISMQMMISYMEAYDYKQFIQINVGFLTVMMVSAVALRRRLFPISFLLGVFLSLCWLISIVCQYYYSGKFSAAFALSLLSTNQVEVASMAPLFLPVTPLFVIAFVSFLTSAHWLSYQLISRWRIRFLWLILLVYVGYLGGIVYRPTTFGAVNSSAIEVLKRTPFYNMQYLLSAYAQEVYFNDIKGTTFTHQYSPQTQNGRAIKNVVLVIGESARRGNMGMYGYRRSNTPNASREASHMTLFSQAVAPAPYTLMAVPLSLTSATVDNTNMSKLLDSILIVATANKIDTQWISSQGHFGEYDTRVSAIAQQAAKTVWVEGVDENVLPKFYDSLKGDGKKLIIVHIFGSHEPICNRVPDRHKFYLDGDAEDTCYDNSIFYTDWILGEMFEKLRGSDTALVYYSDHALIKSRGKYLHASGVPPKQAVDVPMFVWYADSGHKIAKPIIAQPYSTADNYYLIANLLGITIDGQTCKSVLSSCYIFKPPLVMDTEGQYYLYSSLRD